MQSVAKCNLQRQINRTLEIHLQAFANAAQRNLV